MTVLSLDMAYRSFLEVLAGSHPPRYAASLKSSSPRFPNSSWKFGFDSIHEPAVASRKSLLDRAATDKVKLLGYHWTYPGVGYAERKGQGYVFVPSN
jgi:hypothetical protein